ncbi:MAG: hypothetical protein KAT34_07770, partial [Candidatus Aminicenantes bacterium]|nr:hypothetical protein [Candidatus Aminicenantes bacterium]
SADKLILSEIYSANQSEIKDINSQKLYEKIKSRGTTDVMYIKTFSGIIEHLAKEIKPGDAVVFLTAGDLTRTAHRFAETLSKGGR